MKPRSNVEFFRLLFAIASCELYFISVVQCMMHFIHIIQFRSLILNYCILVYLEAIEKLTDGSRKLTFWAHVTEHQCNLAGFDGIKPIVTAHCTSSFARFDLQTGRSGYLFNGTQGNCKVAKSMWILHYKIKGKKKKKEKIIIITKTIPRQKKKQTNKINKNK